MKLRSISATMPALRRCDTPSLVTPQQLESRSLITADTGRRDCERKRRHGMPRWAAVYCRSTATGWAPEAHALLEIRCVGRVQRAAVSEALGDARRCDRGPRAYRSHHRLMAALDGVGTGGPNCREQPGQHTGLVSRYLPADLGRAAQRLVTSTTAKLSGRHRPEISTITL